ncbi:developmentally-regulated G-protein 3 [Tanacetum coccineum]
MEVKQGSPNMTFRKREKGGINFTSIVANTILDLDMVKAICSEYKIHNADVTLRFDATADDLIDVIKGSRCWKSWSKILILL